MHLAVLDLVTTSLEKIANRWSELVDFLRALLGGGTSLMDPVYHDHLLFDNEDFSRSRTYFWAINVLTEFEASISANIEQWEEFRDYLAFPQELDQRGLYSSHEWSGKEQRSLLERSDAYCVRLKRYRGFFLNKRAATVALRDGVRKHSSLLMKSVTEPSCSSSMQALSWKAGQLLASVGTSSSLHSSACFSYPCLSAP